MVTELSLPFSGIKNHVVYQTRDGAPHAIIVKPHFNHSLHFALNGIPAAKMPDGVIRTPFSLKNAAMELHLCDCKLLQIPAAPFDRVHRQPLDHSVGPMLGLRH
jgi:hypothetical protein